jgi:hypothetical protein
MRESDRCGGVIYFEFGENCENYHYRATFAFELQIIKEFK